MGRPSKYNEELQDKADAYLEDQFYTHQEPVPSIAGLAVHLGICRDTVAEWAKDKPEFSGTVRKMLAMQQLGLQSGGLKKEYDAGMARFMLAANHGMSDKAQIDHTSSDGSMTPQDSGQAVLEAIRAKHANPK